MKHLFSIFLCIVSFSTFGQTYNNPGGTFSTCSGTFYDTDADPGGGGQYDDNESITTTFCSNARIVFKLTLHLSILKMVTIFYTCMMDQIQVQP